MIAENETESHTHGTIHRYLEHPLFGIRSRWTAIGIGWLVTVIVGVCLSHWLPRWLLGDGGNQGLANTLDGLVALVIILVGASIFAGIAYGLWNGGPVLAGLIAALPVLVGTLASDGFALEVDLVLALCGAGAASALATYGTSIWQNGTIRPHPYPGLPDSITVSIVLLLLGGTALVRFRDSAGSHTAAGSTAATVLLLVAFGTLVLVLSCCLRDEGAVGTA